MEHSLTHKNSYKDSFVTNYLLFKKCDRIFRFDFNINKNHDLVIEMVLNIYIHVCTFIFICDLFVYENFAGIKISRVFFKMPCPTLFYTL